MPLRWRSPNFLVHSGWRKSYRFQVSQNIAFSTIAFETTTPNTHYTPVSTGPFPDGILYWRVRVESPTASSYSEPILIVKRWATPDNLPVLISPGNNASISFYSSTAFSWQAVPGAARYRFEIASSQNGFSTAVYKPVNLMTTIQPPTKLTNGNYFWRVIPLDPNDRRMPSETRSFSLNYGSHPILPARSRASGTAEPC